MSFMSSVISARSNGAVSKRSYQIPVVKVVGCIGADISVRHNSNETEQDSSNTNNGVVLQARFRARGGNSSRLKT